METAAIITIIKSNDNYYLELTRDGQIKASMSLEDAQTEYATRYGVAVDDPSPYAVPAIVHHITFQRRFVAYSHGVDSLGALIVNAKPFRLANLTGFAVGALLAGAAAELYDNGTMPDLFFLDKEYV